MTKDGLESMRHDTPASRPTLTECEPCGGSGSWERQASGPGTYMLVECPWCGGVGCHDSKARKAWLEWKALPVDDIIDEIVEVEVIADDTVRSSTQKFAFLIEDRVKLEDARGSGPADSSEALTKLFEAVHDAKTAVHGGGSVSAQAVKIATLAMRLAMMSDGLEVAVRRDSMLLVNASVDHVADTTGKNAVLVQDRCILWGAEVTSDVALTEPVLQTLKPSIREAMEKLHSSGLKVKRIVVRGGFVRAYPSDKDSDPRMTADAFPVPASLRLR